MSKVCVAQPDLFGPIESPSSLENPSADVNPYVPVVSTLMEPSTAYCVGQSPVLIYDEFGHPNATAECWQGYWRITENVVLSVPNYNIEGRLFVEGNFVLLNGGSLSWRGFQRVYDSRPDIPLLLNGGETSFLFSNVNVTGNITLETGSVIEVTIQSSDLDSIFGPVHPSDPSIKKVTQKIAEFQNIDNSGTIVLSSSTIQSLGCRKLTIAQPSLNSEGQRTSLALMFSMDDRDCAIKKSSHLAIILPCVLVGVALLALAVTVAAFKIPSFKKCVMPSKVEDDFM